MASLKSAPPSPAATFVMFTHSCINYYHNPVKYILEICSKISCCLLPEGGSESKLIQVNSESKRTNKRHFIKEGGQFGSLVCTLCAKQCRRHRQYRSADPGPDWCFQRHFISSHACMKEFHCQKAVSWSTDRVQHQFVSLTTEKNLHSRHTHGELQVSVCTVTLEDSC